MIKAEIMEEKKETTKTKEKTKTKETIDNIIAGRVVAMTCLEVLEIIILEVLEVPMMSLTLCPWQLMVNRTRGVIISMMRR